jgi:hypothetical protein
METKNNDVSWQAELAAILEDDAGMRRITPPAEIIGMMSQSFDPETIAEMIRQNPWLGGST